MSSHAPSIIENLSSRNARRKREAAERSRAYRERKKAERAPEQRLVDAAIVEGLSFVLGKHAPLLRAKKDGTPMGDASVPILELLATATRVLVQDGYNREKCRSAVADRVASRSEHRDPTNVPAYKPTDDPARIRPPRLWPGDPIPPVVPFRRTVVPSRSLVDMLCDDDDA